jgi:hypothetical protein
MFNKIASKKITEDERHPMTQKIINDVLRKINNDNDVPDVDTSLAQEEQGTREDPEGDHDDVEKQVSKNDTNPKDDQAVVEKQVSNEESPKDDTLADKSEESKNSEEEEGSKASDQNAGGEKDIVDADNYDLDLSLRQVAEDSIARRTRSGKVSAAAITPSKKDKEKKKSAAKPVKYGPSRSSSKVATQAVKKKSLKRKEPPTSDSDFDVEKDVPHISESEAEEEEDQDVELNVVHIGASEKKNPYPELKTTNHAICKSITEGKVKE